MSTQPEDQSTKQDPSPKVRELADRVEKLSIRELLLAAATVYDKSPEMALTLADRAVARMQSQKIFGRDLLQKAEGRS